MPLPPASRANSCFQASNPPAPLPHCAACALGACGASAANAIKMAVASFLPVVIKNFSCSPTLSWSGNTIAFSSLTLSPCGLRRAHISEFPTLSHLFEAMPASAHGDRTRWALGSVTGPATEAGNNPGEPADRPLGMRIFLLGCFAFETGLQGLQHRQFVRPHHVGGR